MSAGRQSLLSLRRVRQQSMEAKARQTWLQQEEYLLVLLCNVVARTTAAVRPSYPCQQRCQVCCTSAISRGCD
eukprot:5005539-Pleurochrysis_carterae.AAC.2